MNATCHHSTLHNIFIFVNMGILMWRVTIIFINMKLIVCTLHFIHTFIYEPSLKCQTTKSLKAVFKICLAHIHFTKIIQENINRAYNFVTTKYFENVRILKSRNIIHIMKGIFSFWHLAHALYLPTILYKLNHTSIIVYIDWSSSSRYFALD